MLRYRLPLVLASATVLALACARAPTNGFDEDDDGATGPGATSTATGATTTGAATTTAAATTGSGGGMGGAGGSGGDASTSAATGGMGTGGMAATTTGAGGSMNNCAHDVCTEGLALTPGCGDPCVDTVCLTDDFCCDASFGEWDDICVDEAVDLCGAQCSVGTTISPGDVVISEIMNNPAAVTDADGEWFEIYNASGASLDLMGLVIHHQANDATAVHTISQSVVVQAGAYAVLAVNGNSTTNGGAIVDYTYASAVSLNNTTDYLAIEDGLGTVIDEVSYSEVSGLDPNGSSRSLDPGFLDHLSNDDDTNFCEASSTMTGGDSGTPGAPNDLCP